MARRGIPIQDVAKEWMKDAAFRAEYEAPEVEFARALSLIVARSKAETVQEQVTPATDATHVETPRRHHQGDKS